MGVVADHLTPLVCQSTFSEPSTGVGTGDTRCGFTQGHGVAIIARCTHALTYGGLTVARPLGITGLYTLFGCEFARFQGGAVTLALSSGGCTIEADVEFGTRARIAAANTADQTLILIWILGETFDAFTGACRLRLAGFDEPTGLLCATVSITGGR